MAHLFNNKYRIPSARLQNWNYASHGMYFVTICTKNRGNFFGKIVCRDATHCVCLDPTHCVCLDPTHCVSTIILQPTELGKIAHSEWYKSIEMRPDMNLEFGEFVVMPNHIHGIIIIGENEFNIGTDAMHCVSNNIDAMHCDNTDAMHCDNTDAMHCASTDAMHCASTDAMHCASTDAMRCVSTPYKNQFAPQSKNLSSIIRGYKSAVTTFARKNGIKFDWQPRFHDHKIRSMDDYYRISNYIINNPTKWHADKFYNVDR